MIGAREGPTWTIDLLERAYSRCGKEHQIGLESSDCILGEIDVSRLCCFGLECAFFIVD